MSGKATAAKTKAHHQEKREAIADAAMREWSKTNFYKTSLSSLAERLGLTKPALYRYFRNKRDLEQTVAARVVDACCRLSRDFLDRAGRESVELEQALRLYVQAYFGFFSRHAEYFFFFILNSLRDPFLDSAEYRELRESEIRLFHRFFEPYGADLNETRRRVRLVFSTGVFWQNLTISRGVLGCQGHRALSPRETQRLLGLITGIALGGFAGDIFDEEVQFAKIDRLNPDNGGVGFGVTADSGIGRVLVRQPGDRFTVFQGEGVIGSDFRIEIL